MMRTVRKSTVYFERAGPLNTTSLLDAVSERVGLKDVKDLFTKLRAPILDQLALVSKGGAYAESAE